MPVGYIFLHLLFSAACLIVALRIPARSRWGYVLGSILLILLVVGFAVEHRQKWAWAAMRLPVSGTVFLTNLLLEGTVVLCAILWRMAGDRKARSRAGVLCGLLVGVALGSYAWYFLPVPAHLTGIVDSKGYCPQTTHESCSAASAAMLLAGNGIPATEAEMATLCLTRRGLGTTPLGLFRGLSIRSAKQGLYPRLISLSSPTAFRKSHCPSIISVGLKSGCPSEVEGRMISYGWEPGQQHTVVILDADPAGQWLDVADPTNGHERWPTNDLNYIWDGYALILR